MTIQMEQFLMCSFKAIRRLLPALSLPLLTITCWADDGFDAEFEQKPWAEIEVQLPAFPEAENQIPFRVGYHTDTKYLIDGNSLSLGADGVIRYTLLVISASGARNVSYEGLRCATGERRVYAFGRSDKTWSKARGNQWVRVQGSTNNHYVDLYSNYFCIVGAPDFRNTDDIRRILRSGGRLPDTAS
jgi:hypothetical protein